MVFNARVCGVTTTLRRAKIVPPEARVERLSFTTTVSVGLPLVIWICARDAARLATRDSYPAAWDVFP